MSGRVPSTKPDLLSAALDYAASGQPVFPCYPITVELDDTVHTAKSPLTSGGLYAATTDPDQIRRWWTRWPEALIGLPTGLIYDVLDVDIKPDVDGRVAFRFLAGLGLIWDNVVRIVGTASGGSHYYFPTDPDNPMRNATFARHGIDLRGAGGYVIAAPGLVYNPDGKGVVGAYETRADRPASEGRPLDHEKVRALLGGTQGSRQGAVRGARASRPRKGEGSPEALAAWLRSRRPGERNSALFWAACRAAEDGQDTAPLLDAAMEAGLSEAEARRTIRSAMNTTEHEHGEGAE